MAILSLQKPDKVVMIEENATEGKFEFRPLEPGFGITIGNALRRILLSSLEGFAIQTLRISGVSNEFESIAGVREDVSRIILALKQVRFKRLIDEYSEEHVSLTIQRQSEFRAGDIGGSLVGFEVLNPDLVICHLEPKVQLQIELTIGKGRGWQPADENLDKCTVVGTIPVDSIYTPIRNVRYDVSDYRVGQKTDYEKLTIDVATDGSISPREALKSAANILIEHFSMFSDNKMTLENEADKKEEEFDEKTLRMRQLLKTRLTDMNLSVRALNCLKAANVETLGRLVELNKGDLLKFRNFGKKSLSELEKLLEDLGLSFGMNTEKYR